MSVKGQTLRALVQERLSAAVEEIFVLFENTIAGFEEELIRKEEENQRKQELLDSVLKPRVLLLKTGEKSHSTSPEPGLSQDPNQDLDQDLNESVSWIKEEPEEQSLKQEEQMLPVPIPYNEDAASDIDFTGDFFDELSSNKDLDILGDQWQNLNPVSIVNVTSCAMENSNHPSQLNSPSFNLEHLKSRNFMANFTGTQQKTMPATLKNSKPRPTKKQFCLFCQKPITKLARHLRSLHPEEPDVALAFSLRKGSKKRFELLRSIKKRGNFSHNAMVAASGVGEFVPCRRTKAGPAQMNDYVHCRFCQGLFIRKSFWKHLKTNHKVQYSGRKWSKGALEINAFELPLGVQMNTSNDSIDESTLPEATSPETTSSDKDSSDSTPLEPPPTFPETPSAFPEPPSTFTEPPPVLPEPLQKCNIPKKRRRVRRWTAEEISAVEKHMMDFIKRFQVPSKKSCMACLLSEPKALENRDWTAVKNYVHNRISRYKKTETVCY